MKTAIKYVGQKQISWQNEANITHRKYKEPTHMSLTDHPISQSSLDISICTPIIAAEVKNYHSIQCRLSGKIVFFIYWYHKESLLSGDIYSDSILLLDLIWVEFLMCLNCCRSFVPFGWYALSGVKYMCPGIGTSYTDWTQLIRFHLKTGKESSFQNVLNKKQDPG
jgi:hypothetical protein